MTLRITRTVAMVLILVGLGLLGFYEINANYTYGCFCVGSNVKTITLSSATLYSGTTAFGSSEATSSIAFSLNNPGSGTTITSLTLGEEGRLHTSITLWSTTRQATDLVNFSQIYSFSSPGSNALGGGEVSSFVLYPVSNTSQEAIIQNHSYNYVIDFANGESASGTLTAVNGTDASYSTTSCTSSPYTETVHPGNVTSWTVITTYSC